MRTPARTRRGSSGFRLRWYRRPLRWRRPRAICENPPSKLVPYSNPLAANRKLSGSTVSDRWNAQVVLCQARRGEAGGLSENAVPQPRAAFLAAS
jgi:hypothetical protein